MCVILIIITKKTYNCNNITNIKVQSSSQHVYSVYVDASDLNIRGGNAKRTSGIGIVFVIHTHI